MNRNWIKRAGLAVVAIAIVSGFVYALREEPALVDTAMVSRGAMQVSVREEGMTRVREVYTISTPIAGHLARTLLEEGDRVEAGQTVVASIHPLDPPLIDERTKAELLAARDAAEAAVRIADIERVRVETALRLSRDELERALKLHGPGIISESSMQKAENEVDLLEAQVDAATATINLRKAQLASAEASLTQPTSAERGAEGCCVNLHAPVDGVVLQMLAKSEQAVASGARIAEIGDPQDLEVVVDLLSSDAVQIATGAKAQVSDWGGATVLAARVKRIDPAAFTKVSALGIEEQRVNAVLELEDKDARLGHGYRVFAELVVWESGDSLRVPISALFRAGREWRVFAVKDNRLREVSVTLGHMNDEMAEVLSGLGEGETVVVHPGDTLAEGSLVAPRGREG